jgi:hypothetical protein
VVEKGTEYDSQRFSTVDQTEYLEHDEKEGSNSVYIRLRETVHVLGNPGMTRNNVQIAPMTISKGISNAR